jgi:hypothetical protein
MYVRVRRPLNPDRIIIVSLTMTTIALSPWWVHSSGIAHALKWAEAKSNTLDASHHENAFVINAPSTSLRGA